MLNYVECSVVLFIFMEGLQVTLMEEVEICYVFNSVSFRRSENSLILLVFLTLHANGVVFPSEDEKHTDTARSNVKQLTAYTVW